MIATAAAAASQGFGMRAERETACASRNARSSSNSVRHDSHCMT